MIVILWQCSPAWGALSLLMIATETGTSLGALYFLKKLFDSAGGLTANGMRPVLFHAAMAGACTLGSICCRSIALLARSTQSLRVADHVNQLIHRQAVHVDLAYFESPEFLDGLDRARQAGTQRPANVVHNLLATGRNVFLFGGAFLAMISVHPVLPLVLSLALVPALWVRLISSRQMHEWRARRVTIDRISRYLDGLMTSPSHAKELRTGLLGDHFCRLYDEVRAPLRKEQLTLNLRSTAWELAASAIAILAFFAAVLWLARAAANGQRTVGDVLLFLLLFQRVHGTGTEVIQQMTALYQDQLYLQSLFSFLDIHPVMTRPVVPKPMPRPIRDGIRFENVGFRYPGAARDALHGIHLHLPPGQIVGMVGANGSGKSTLIRLLCRLYDPTEGRITLDGIDIRELDPEAYRQAIRVLFQDFTRYSETARENIRIGDLTADPTSPRIKLASMRSGADEFIRYLQDGYETQLGRVHRSAQELSGGEWQRLALARTFMADSDYLVLDEPSSALDLAAEQHLSDQLPHIVGKRGALILSHRLPPIRHAHIIHVLENGHILRSGTYDELLASGGFYTPHPH